jgi:two-component system, NarL family, nitrate/nitrite response regulator NarL
MVDITGEGIRVALLSRNELAREGLRRILISQDFVVCGSVRDSTALASGQTKDGDPEIIIVDNAGSDALETCRELNERYPQARLVLLADNFDIEEVALAFGRGVDGYIVKEISCEPLIESLRLVALGEKVLPSQLASNLGAVSLGSVAEDWHENISVAGLSDREVEILWCLTLGMANKVVSRRLEISEATVKVHVKAILRKLKVANRTQAAIWAVKHGFERHVDQGAQPVELLAPSPRLLEYSD